MTTHAQNSRERSEPTESGDQFKWFAKYSASVALLIVLAAVTLPASAVPVVLDFNAQPTGSNFGSLSENGFTVTGSGPGIHFVSSGGSSFCSPSCVDNGTNHLMGYSGAEIFTITSNSGALFSLTGFDGGESHSDRASRWAEQIRVEGFFSGGGSVVALFDLDFINDGSGSLIDFQSFLLPGTFQNLTSVSFAGIGSSSSDDFTLDNIALQISDVPEPASLALLGLGLAGFGYSRRRSS